MVTFLITGGAGFIGSNFIQYLFDNYGDGIEVINLDSLTYAANLKNLEEVEKFPGYHFIKGDICDSHLTEEIMSTYDVDYLVHFAAESHVDRSIQDAGVFVMTNVMGTLNLLNCAKRAWETKSGYKEGKRFLYVSTDEVYGALDKDGYFTEESPLNPRNPYAVSKASADMMVKAFFDTYGFPVLRTRCSNNYGPNQNAEKLIPNFIQKALNSEKLPVYGDGLAIRDWLYVKDHCSAIECVLTNGRPGDIFNVGGNNEKTTLEIADVLTGILKSKYHMEIPSDYIDFVPDRKGHDRRYAIDPGKICTELGWKPVISFDEGIAETVSWYMDRQYLLA